MDNNKEMIEAVSYTHLSSDVAARMAQADKRGDLYKEKPFVMDYEGCLLYTSRCV